LEKFLHKLKLANVQVTNSNREELDERVSTN